MSLLGTLFGSSSRQLERALGELVDTRLQLAGLMRQWNRLVERVNEKGGEDFLERGVLPEDAPAVLSEDDITKLLQLCHPDKHGGKKSAQDMTAKLLGMRKR